MQQWQNSKIAHLELKYNDCIRQYRHTSLSKHALLDVILVGCSYIFGLNHSIISNWAVFGLCTYWVQ
jgi:hypothetical protein